ncbi:hypothetical protein [Raineyella sp. LH-20]|uniref:hypothetical protein n=1 Tax=Raineyella sp. LH-20 TaxID=3081204 RepID=UPI0029543517|nr:hypothetical protein [Raineyella sp. LH-20]WOP19654.1 hypothetical protein R0146_05100 [Raineyella sp. LH-20]
MFTLADTPVKFIVLFVLFVWCTAWSVYELTRPQDRSQRVSNVLHLVMSLVMVLMVSTVTWKPFVGLVTGPVLIAVFGLATAWFVGLAVARRGTRGHFFGHAAMFGAMAWHLVGMVTKMPLMAASMQQGSMAGMQHGGAQPGAAMGGMQQGMGGMGTSGMTGMTGMGSMGGMTPVQAASQPGGSMWIIALVGIPFMVYLLIAAVRELVAAVRPAVAGHEHVHTDATATSAATAIGTATKDTDAGAAGSAVGHGSTQTMPATRTVEQTAAAAATCHEVRPVGSAAFRLSALAGFAMNFGMFWMSTGLLTPILPWMKLLSF